MIKTKKKAIPMARINTRITLTQQKYIKAKAKKDNKTEGEVIRGFIDFWITNQ